MNNIYGGLEKRMNELKEYHNAHLNEFLNDNDLDGELDDFVCEMLEKWEKIVKENDDYYLNQPQGDD